MIRDRRILEIAVVACVFGSACGMAQTRWSVVSPDGRTEIQLTLPAPGQTADFPAAQKRLYYEVRHCGRRVLGRSPLGIRRTDEDFVDGLSFVKATSVEALDETYTLIHGKRKVCHAQAGERTMTFRNRNGARVEVILRAYNDGVAFRYRFPEQSDKTYTVTHEASGFRLPPNGRMWVHPYDVPGTYTPAYERYCVDDVPVTTDCPSETGWAFPLLFHTADRG